MSETINVIDSSIPAILILNAMTAVANHGDIIEKFRVVNGPNVEVTLLVNGVEVPVVAALVDCWERLEAERDEAIKKAALALITETHLDGLYDAIKDAEWRIKQQLDLLEER